MAIDNVMLGVLNAYFRAAADASGFVLKRSAHTTYVKESNDFTTAILTPDGEQFAYPVSLAAQTYIGINYKALFDSLAPWSEGDIGITNCPYYSKGVSTHLADYHVFKPIFAHRRLIAFAWNFIHCSDMGGIVAGSILPSAYELYQEGIRIPPKKIYKAGVLQQDVKDFMLSNVRIPDKNWGDLGAMVAALGTAEQRVHAAVEKWGLETVIEGQQALIGYAETRARALINRLPDGEWLFHDYLEDDVISDMPVRVKLRVTKGKDGDLHLDYSGSDPQIGAAFNLASAGHHPFLCVAIFGYFRTMDPAIPINGGLIRPIKITAPSGSIVNAEFPAACGVRYAVNQLNYGILQAVLAQALPGQIPAAGSAQATILSVSIMDAATGRRRVGVIQPMIGGSGARPDRDGVSATDFSLGALANTPTESVENELGLLVSHYGIVPDSGGPGRFRGGLAARLDFQVFQPDAILTARGMDRFKFQPWGLDGGRAGATGDAWVRTPGETRRVGKINMLRLGIDETFSVQTPGGGGYGDPLARAVEDVAEDVRLGYVTKEAAQEVYGVVFCGDRVDEAETKALRAELAEGRYRSGISRATGKGHWPANFDGGPARASYEKIFTPEVSDEMAKLLFSAPAPVRYYSKQKLVERIRKEAESSGAVGAKRVYELWQELLPQLGLASRRAS